MEDGLRDAIIKVSEYQGTSVLILVLMEDGLRERLQLRKLKSKLKS